MAGKADKITYDQRVEVVYRLILHGWTPTQIVQNITNPLSKDYWGVNSRQTYNYIRTAYRRIREDAAKLRRDALEEHLLARRLLRRETADPKVQLEVLKDEAKLLGLYPPVQATLATVDLTRLTDEQLERIANGEDPRIVLAAPSAGGAGEEAPAG